MRIEADIYSVVQGKDLAPMQRLTFAMFKKRSIAALSNDQLEKLLSKLREEYK